VARAGRSILFEVHGDRRRRRAEAVISLRGRQKLPHLAAEPVSLHDSEIAANEVVDVYSWPFSDMRTAPMNVGFRR
jgi:hypothetical protein